MVSRTTSEEPEKEEHTEPQPKLGWWEGRARAAAAFFGAGVGQVTKVEGRGQIGNHRGGLLARNQLAGVLGALFGGAADAVFGAIVAAFALCYFAGAVATVRLCGWILAFALHANFVLGAATIIFACDAVLIGIAGSVATTAHTNGVDAALFAGTAAVEDAGGAGFVFVAGAVAAVRSAGSSRALLAFWTFAVEAGAAVLAGVAGSVTAGSNALALEAFAQATTAIFGAGLAGLATFLVAGSVAAVLAGF